MSVVDGVAVRKQAEEHGCRGSIPEQNIYSPRENGGVDLGGTWVLPASAGVAEGRPSLPRPTFRLRL